MTDRHQQEQSYVRTWVQMGFFTIDQLDARIDNLGVSDAHVIETLKDYARRELHRKQVEESSWPELTQCDVLDEVFRELAMQGIVGFAGGETLSDAEAMIADDLQREPGKHVHGYCFYNQQDAEDAVNHGTLHVSFNTVFPDSVGAVINIGMRVAEALFWAGLPVTWNGTADQRIRIDKIDWKRRSTNNDTSRGALDGATVNTDRDRFFCRYDLLTHVPDPSWTIYENPAEYPGKFVARKFLLDKPTSECFVAESLQSIRDKLPAGLAQFARHHSDDPTIVESWI